MRFMARKILIRRIAYERNGQLAQLSLLFVAKMRFRNG